MFGSETFRDDYPFTFHFLERLSVLLFVAQNNVLFKLFDLDTVDDSQNLCKDHIQSMIIGYNNYILTKQVTTLDNVVYPRGGACTYNNNRKLRVHRNLLKKQYLSPNRTKMPHR